MSSKLTFLFGAVILSLSIYASEEPNISVTPYLFNNRIFFSDRPLVVMNGRLIYEDTREDFIVANGQKVDATYSLPSAPMCVGCKHAGNTPMRILNLLKIPFDRCLITPKIEEQRQDTPVKKEKESKA